MNNRQLYLAWLRTVAPSVYVSAVRRATGRNRNLGGLSSDLVQQALAPNVNHSFLGDDTSGMLDPITVTASYDSYTPISADPSMAPATFTPTFDASTVAAPTPFAIDNTGQISTVAPTSSGASSIFTGILAAVTAVGAGVINASNQSKLIALNTTRAQQGLGPVDASGRLISGAGTTATGSALLAFERAISGGSSGSLLPIMAVLGIGAFFMFRKKSA
jgi:hypothetical protein